MKVPPLMGVSEGLGERSGVQKTGDFKPFPAVLSLGSVSGRAEGNSSKGKS